MTITDDAIDRAARWLFEDYCLFYQEFLKNIDLARLAFEKRDFTSSVRVSAHRLSLYSQSIQNASNQLKSVYPEIHENIEHWQEVEEGYRTLIQGDYTEDVGLAYLHSLRRKIYQVEWRSEDYFFSESNDLSDDYLSKILVSFDISTTLDTPLLAMILAIPKFTRSYSNLEEDTTLMLSRISGNLARSSRKDIKLLRIDMVNAGFFRNRGAYLIGRLVFENGTFLPLIIALLNDETGIYVDAVLTSDTYAHNLFSSTLANFHVTTPYYHEVCAFLKLVMPKRPLGLHYSTIGYNHLGKVAVMSDLKQELSGTGYLLENAVGQPGTVAMGFASSNSSYNLKVIRDKPTKNYKWGEFGGVEKVIRKYTRVHEINRTGSMLDSIIYYNIRLDRKWFSESLLSELLEQATETVSLRNEDVVFQYLIVQIKLTPLPVFLETASQKQAETAINNLGYCIKNNASANIFNRDLDARNYGIGSYLKVYLFDYDALEDLVEVKIRTNLDREAGEEDIPDWFFEDGVVFLPEELISGLCIPQRPLSDLFARRHASLLGTDYWSQIQQDLEKGVVPGISVYPDSEKIRLSI
ncbi:MAG: isocitrate dehydrogenase kinase/phosphatase [Gammaproteobacteria bacterium]